MLEPEEALEASLEVVAQPDAADAGGTDLEPAQAELVGDAVGAVRGVLEGVGEDLASSSHLVRPSWVIGGLSNFQSTRRGRVAAVASTAYNRGKCRRNTELLQPGL